MIAAGLPAAAAGVPAGGGAPAIAPQVPPTTHPYREWYTDHTRDPFIGSYPAIYANYSITVANTPAVVREKIFSNGNNGTPIGEALLVRPAGADAADPGRIQGYHRIVRYSPSLVGPTAFDNVGYAFLGDIQDGQAPHTVIWDNDNYRQAGDAQVPTSAYLDQLLAANPNLELVGPFAAGTPDTELVNTRFSSVFVPNRYIAMVMDDHLSPRQAWLRLRGAIVADGLAADCAPLIDWLRVALTRSAAATPSRVVTAVPTTQALGTIAEANTFRKFRAAIIHRDHPNLHSNQVTQGAQLVAQGLTDMATQTRLQREADENRRQRESHKRPSDIFASGLPKLMRWCQIGTEDQLPAIYTAAANSRKGERRRLLQDAISVSMETLGYRHDFPISTKLANKILDLEWSSRLPDDLSLGVHIFTLGWVIEEQAEVTRARNAQADALYGGHAAPSLRDTEAILDNDDEVHIPGTLAQLRRGVEQAHAVWATLLPTGHEVVRMHRDYRAQLVESEMLLEREQPRDPAHRYLVPALLARRLQIDLNVWMVEQARYNHMVPLPDLNDVFIEISRKRDWAPDFPATYFQAPAHQPAPAPVAPVTSPVLPPAIPAGGVGGGGILPPPSSQTPGVQPPGTIQRMVLNPTVNPVFARFQEMGVQTQELKQRLRAAGVTWPRMPQGHHFCPTYHIKGACNTRCGNAADHIPHTAEEDAGQVAWCDTHYRVA